MRSFTPKSCLHFGLAKLLKFALVSDRPVVVIFAYSAQWFLGKIALTFENFIPVQRKLKKDFDNIFKPRG